MVVVVIISAIQCSEPTTQVPLEQDVVADFLNFTISLLKLI